MAAVMQPEGQEVSCVVIPTGATTLLLPNICVAEILPWRRIKPVSDGPDWCLGVLGWRGESVPVVSFDRFNGDSRGPGSGRCLVVMNRARSSDSRAFYALMTAGLPRMVQLAPDDIAGQPSGQPNHAEAMRARVGAEDIVVPNLTKLEEAITTLKL